jgi:hypothetical protein
MKWKNNEEYYLQGCNATLWLPPASMLASFSAYYSTLKMEVICYSKMSVDFQQTTRYYILEDGTLHYLRCESLKRVTFSGLHGLISLKIVLFTITAVRISNPTRRLKLFNRNGANKRLCRFEWKSYKLCRTYWSMCTKRFFIQFSWFIVISFLKSLSSWHLTVSCVNSAPHHFHQTSWNSSNPSDLYWRNPVHILPIQMAIVWFLADSSVSPDEWQKIIPSHHCLLSIPCPLRIQNHLHTL